MTYLQPLFAFLLFLCVAGLFQCRRGGRKRAPALLVAGVAGIVLLSWPPVSWLSSRVLECWYDRGVLPAADAQAIVVLSANVLRPVPGRPEPVADRDTAERCQYAAWLHRTWQPLPVLACGGPSVAGGPPMAATMKRVLVGAGVPEPMIWTEERSRSTHENALYAAEILRAKGITRIALVTETYHMLRAELCFRKQGLTVTPAPCGVSVFELEPDAFLPGAGAIRRNEVVLHELLGLAWYRVRGRI